MPVRYHIPLPNLNQCIRTFQFIFQDEQIDSDINLTQLTQETEDYTGRDINEIINDAKVFGKMLSCIA